MARPKKNQPHQAAPVADLLSTAAPVASPRQEFRAADSSPWFIERFDLLLAEVPGLRPADLPLFLAQLAKAPSVLLVAQRAFGLFPRLVTTNDVAADRRVWPGTEIAAALGLSLDEYRARLDSLRGIWAAAGVKPEDHAAADETKRADRAVKDGKLDQGFDFDDSVGDELLRRHAFDHLKLKGAERQWFLTRLQEIAKLLAHTPTKETARGFVLNELELRRAEADYFDDSTKGDSAEEKAKRSAIEKRLANCRQHNSETIEMLQKTAPWFFAVDGLNLRGCIAEIIEGWQRWKVSEDGVMLATIWTATDIQILHRASVQSLAVPGLQIGMRAGLTAFLAEARLSLFNPRFRSLFPHKRLAAMDAGYRDGYLKAFADSGDPLPDLLKDGPEGEHEPLRPLPAPAPRADGRPNCQCPGCDQPAEHDCRTADDRTWALLCERHFKQTHPAS